MTERHECPPRETWTRLIDGKLTRAESDGLATHLDVCDACRRSLEELTAETPLAWTSASLERGASSEALEQALRDLEQASPEVDSVETVEVASTDDLAFLEPSQRSDALGRLDEYEVLELLGRGSMGLVLKAFEPSLSRVVAIKVLAPQVASCPRARRRFVREAQAAAAVAHPHVVPIHAVAEKDGLPYLVLQYVGGVSLQGRLDREGPLPPREVLRIGMQIASGLAAAHAQGLIHRDIKPANVLLENGVQRVKITDFGLARAIDDASVTETGVVAGTPHYMAPEQARGEALDARADLFSLGSLLWAVATGEPPFRGTTALSVVRRVADESPPRADAVCPELPAWLADLIERLHAARPEDRFQSAEEVAEVIGQHLARLQQGLPVSPDEGPVALTQSGAKAEERASSSRWMGKVAAAAFLLGLVAFGVSEATGKTHLVDCLTTVLRFRTADGVVAVHVDDPDVQVAYDRDGEEVLLSSTNGIIPEIRLKPGRHALRFAKDGETVLTEWVTVTKGGRQIVRVDLEAVERESRDVLPPQDAAAEVGNDAGAQEVMRIRLAVRSGLPKSLQPNVSMESEALRGAVIGRVVRIIEKRMASALPGDETTVRREGDGIELSVSSRQLSEQELELLPSLLTRRGELSFFLVENEPDKTARFEEFEEEEGIWEAGLAEWHNEQTEGGKRAAIPRPPRYVVRSLRPSAGAGAETGGREMLLLDTRRETSLVQAHVVEAALSLDSATLQEAISFRLSDQGARRIRDMTRENIGRRIAIVVDGEVVSAPTIRSEIRADVQISGQFSPAEVRELVAVLSADPLPAEVEVLSIRLDGAEKDFRR